MRPRGRRDGGEALIPEQMYNAIQQGKTALFERLLRKHPNSPATPTAAACGCPTPRPRAGCPSSNF